MIGDCVVRWSPEPVAQAHWSKRAHGRDKPWKEEGIGDVLPSWIELGFVLHFISSVHNKWASLVAQMVKNLPANAGDSGSIPGQEDPLEREMATHSRILGASLK